MSKPFDNHTHNLGSTNLGYDIHTVDQAFRTSYLHTGNTCLICNSTAKYKLIAKHSHLDTIQIQDRGFICQHCITQGYISPSDYALREL